jgi:pyruvate dehydrogenase E1 component alpha subunit
LGANGIVGGGLPIATGVGLSIKLRNSGQVCLVLFGDGATNEGSFHESLNLASVWKLPVVFLCENNQYGMSMAIRRSANVERLSDRACAYGIPGVTVDGNDVLAVYDVLGEAVERARRGEGPSLVETVTYRWRGHSKSDRQVYRTRDELKEWQARDPIPRFAARLVEAGIIAENEVDTYRQMGYQVIDEAAAYADACPEPSLETIMEGVYA